MDTNVKVKDKLVHKPSKCVIEVTNVSGNTILGKVIEIHSATPKYIKVGNKVKFIKGLVGKSYFPVNDISESKIPENHLSSIRKIFDTKYKDFMSYSNGTITEEQLMRKNDFTDDLLLEYVEEYRPQ